MNTITQILASFRGDLPRGSATAAAIDRGAGAEEIAACAHEEGLQALASALFEAVETQDRPNAGETDAHIAAQVDERLREFRAQLPADSLTAQAIDRGAPIEEISECAQEEGLDSLASMLFEAEQENARNGS